MGNAPRVAHMLVEALRDNPQEPVVVRFEPGAIGIDAIWDWGLVTQVQLGGQANRLGVKRGWTFHALEDRPYIKQHLDALLTGSRSFSVTFITGAEGTPIPSVH